MTGGWLASYRGADQGGSRAVLLLVLAFSLVMLLWRVAGEALRDVVTRFLDGVRVGGATPARAAAERAGGAGPCAPAAAATRLGRRGVGERRAGWGGEAGSAVVEFVLVTVVAVGLALAVAQLGLFLWERNALMGSLSEGARVAATEGRSVADGRRVAAELWRRSVGGRVAGSVPVEGVEAGGVVVLRAEGTLPSFVPGVPGLPVRVVARMSKEEAL
jgi:hypothetical protein